MPEPQADFAAAVALLDEGHEVAEIDLVPYLRDTPPRIDWPAVPIPSLTSPPLPPGYPAPSWTVLGTTIVHYGFTEDPDLVY